jgi:hypothetical protein
MAETKTYYLVKGHSIGAKGLPGGKLTAEKKNVKITDEQLACFSASVEYMLANGILSNDSGADEVTENTVTSEKSDKRIKLETEAAELGVTFTDDMTDKDLKAAIKTVTDAQTARSKLESEATELKVAFTSETTDADLKAAIDKALEA